jgi:hypothetical protein
MDFLLSHLGENKVTQVIQTNEFEQAIEYNGHNVQNPDSSMYEDLLKRKMINSSSSTSISSRVSSYGNLVEDNAYYPENSLLYAMCFVKQPSMGIYSKDRIPRILSQFRKSILEDNNAFNIKKISKTQKTALKQYFESNEPIQVTDDSIPQLFSHLLKSNIIIVRGKQVFKGIICNEDAFDTIVVIDKYVRGHYRLCMFKGGRHVIPWEEAKTFMFTSKYVDIKFLDLCSVNDLRVLAETFDISTIKVVDGKKHKLLKDELKQELTKKI